jgi:hypothetical protein
MDRGLVLACPYVGSVRNQYNHNKKTRHDTNFEPRSLHHIISVRTSYQIYMTNGVGASFLGDLKGVYYYTVESGYVNGGWNQE